MRTLRYAFTEAVVSLWRGRRSVALAVLTIAAALFVLGGFLVVTSNLERLLAGWREAAEFSVYLQDGITAEQHAGLERTLRDSPAVSAVEFVSKEAALRRFKRNFGDLSDAVDGMPANPLPASFEVRLRSGADRQGLDALAARAGAMPGVSETRFDRTWLDRVTGAVTLLRTAGIGLAGVLVLAAALTVASVVRLALLARRDEVEIMHLVGAPLAFIRGPFVMEGVLQGGAGALVALALLRAGYALVRDRFGAIAAGGAGPASLGFLPLPVSLALLAGGMLLGCVGGLVAAVGAAERDR